MGWRGLQFGKEEGERSNSMLKFPFYLVGKYRYYLTLELIKNMLNYVFQKYTYNRKRMNIYISRH